MAIQVSSSTEGRLDWTTIRRTCESGNVPGSIPWRGCREKALKWPPSKITEAVFFSSPSLQQPFEPPTFRLLAVLKAPGTKVIGVSCRLSEAEVHWRGFLQQLQKRGLEGVQLIVSDDHSGLRAARRAVFPSVPWQRCQYLSQNAQRYARRSDQRAAIATDIRDIFNAPSGGEGEAMLRTRVEQYRDRNPELADWMETNLPEGFTVFRFARSTWRRIRTNNGLENLFRFAVVGIVLTNRLLIEKSGET